MGLKISIAFVKIFLVIVALYALTLVLKDRALAVTYSPVDEAELNTVLSNANDGDVIELSASIELVAGITIDDNIDFRGNNYSLSGDESFSDSVITVNAGNTVSFSELAISGGSSLNGGGIYTDGTVSLYEVILNGNDASNWGGGIYGSSNSSITIQNSVITDNVAEDYGAGVHARGALTVSNSSFISNTISNSSQFGAGIYVTSASERTVNISSSTFTDGSAYFGGGITAEMVGTLNLTNNTFYENVNVVGGGVYLDGRNGELEVNFTNNTFALNETSGLSNGNDIYYNDESGSDTTINLVNNIFGSDGPVNFLAVNNSGGTLEVNPSYNISEDNSLSSYGGTSNQHSTDPEFDAAGLADNGGEAETLALDTVDSPAVDAGTSTGAPLVDQRGELRDSNPDIGAYEFDHVTLAPVVSVPGNNFRDNELYFSYYLRENPSSGTVQITFDSEYDFNDVTLTMEDSITDVIVDFVIPEDGDLTGISQIDSSTSDTLNSGSYTVTVSYQDSTGNPAGTTTRTNVIFDTVPPYIVIYYGMNLESTSPITSTYIKIGEQPSTGDIDVEITDETTLTYENFSCGPDTGSYDLKCNITITGSGTFTIRATDELGQVSEVTSPVYTVNISESEDSSTSDNQTTYGYIAAVGNAIIDEGENLEEEELENINVSDSNSQDIHYLAQDEFTTSVKNETEGVDSNDQSATPSVFILAIIIAAILFTSVIYLKIRSIKK